MMLSFMVLLGIFLPKTVATATAAADTQDVLISDLINWLRANGAFINDKIQIRHINPDDPSSPRGLFALKPLEEGETVCNIPWELIISPSEKPVPQDERHEQLDCGTINAVFEEIGKSDSDNMTPYGKYLLSQPRGYTLGFWSNEGQDLFWEMTDNDKLPPVWIDDILQDWEDECGGNIDNSLHVFAVMLVKTRADYQYLVPFYDMTNHNNRKTNVVHKYHTYRDPIDKTGFEIVTSKPILAGDELFISYNQCTICDQYYDWFGTPEMFLHYGFVEGYPQRWLFDFARVKFDLDWRDGDEETGEVVLNFLVPPSKKGMELLKNELDRLDKFGQQREQTFLEGDIPAYELKSLWEYYDALHDALRYAVESNVTLFDDVWLMDDNWWVKDGTLKAEDVGEHSVRPSKKLDNEEL